MSILEIYEDIQDPSNQGWAYRDTRPGSPLGSGPIDGDAAAALDAIMAGDELTVDQDQALRALVTDEIGAALADVTLADVGALWPAE
jgi:hypothetical protein